MDMDEKDIKKSQYIVSTDSINGSPQDTDISRLKL